MATKKRYWDIPGWSVAAFIIGAIWVFCDRLWFEYEKPIFGWVWVKDVSDISYRIVTGYIGAFLFFLILTRARSIKERRVERDEMRATQVYDMTTEIAAMFMTIGTSMRLSAGVTNPLKVFEIFPAEGEVPEEVIKSAIHRQASDHGLEAANRVVRQLGRNSRVSFTIADRSKDCLNNSGLRRFEHLRNDLEALSETVGNLDELVRRVQTYFNRLQGFKRDLPQALK